MGARTPPGRPPGRGVRQRPGRPHYPRGVVLRRLPLRALAGGVTGLLLGAAALAGPQSVAQEAPSPLAPASASAPGSTLAVRDDDAPLAITIEELTPGALPRTGPIVVSGTITNVDLESWQDIRLYPVFSEGPNCDLCAEAMLTSAALEEAAGTDPEAPVGERDTTVRAEVTSLAPGQSVSYSLRIPQAVLRSLFREPTAGVYWFGVHALGASATSPRDTVADGRARTFLPYLPPRTDDTVDTAIVMPLRGAISHAADGSLDGTAQWRDALGVEGSLGGPLAFGAASGIDPVTWLVDPAVLDSVRHLADRNLPREVTPVPDPDEPVPSDDPSDEESGADGDDDAEEPGLSEDDPLVRAATTWLQQAETLLGADTVAALPYGDPDISSAAQHLPSLYRTAREQPSDVLAAWGVDPLPVVAGPDGYLDPTGLATIDDDAVLLLGDQMFPAQAFSDRPPADGLVGDRPVVVTSSSAASGGPGPDPAIAAVALRQRILSEAAVRIIAAGEEEPEPLVVVLPTGVTASDAAAFWDGLDIDWIDLTALDELLAAAGPGEGAGTDDRQIDTDDLNYPAAQDLDEVSGVVLVEAGRLIRAARAFQALLGEDYAIGEELIGEAIAATSYSLREDSGVPGRLARTRLWVEEQLEQVSIDAPNGVTLSGTSGGFSVSVRNTLPYPVTVNIAASTDNDATIGVTNPIQLAANSRTSVPITADMSRTGVHNVTLRLTDVDGQFIGADDTLPLRSGQVGIVIWIIIGTGATILFVAIGIRLVRRVRRESADRNDPAEDDAAVEATP